MIVHSTVFLSADALILESPTYFIFLPPELIPNNVDGDDDPHPLSAIGVGRSQQECNAYENYTPFHAITSLTTSTFRLPFTANFISRQFQALQRDYGVEIGDYKVTSVTF